MSDQYITANEMKGIIALIRVLSDQHEDGIKCGVSVGDVVVYDSNGESLGTITYKNDEYVFEADRD